MHISLSRIISGDAGRCTLDNWYYLPIGIINLAERVVPFVFTPAKTAKTKRRRGGKAVSLLKIAVLANIECSPVKISHARRIFSQCYFDPEVLFE